jgi:hypothetical protein
MEAIISELCADANFADSQFQVAVKSIGFTEIEHLGVVPSWIMYHMLSDRGF